MLKFTALAAITLVGTALAAPAALADGQTTRTQQVESQHFERIAYSDRGDRHRGRGHRGWNGPEGYFVVYARACPDLMEDRRDRRVDNGRRDRREDRRDRRVLDCPDRAWDYVPSHRERRMGRYGDRLRPTVAYWDRRDRQYYVETRWGEVPVEIRRGRGRHHHARHHRRDRHYDRRGGHYRWD